MSQETNISASLTSTETKESSEIKPDRRHIITCSDDGTLRQWERESGAQIGNEWRDDEDEEQEYSIALSPNSEIVASGSGDGMVKLWNIETRKVIAKWTGHNEQVRSVCWSRDGRQVATGSLDGTARLWDVESGETVLGPIMTGHRRIEVVAFSPDASNFATGGNNNGIKIWNARTGELLSTLEQDSWVWSLVWTSDQKKLVAGHLDGSITIFDTATWEEIALLEDHTSTVHALSLFQNDRLLASAAAGEDTARLWNLDTNLPIGAPLQHQDSVLHTAFSADGRFLATACNDKNAYVWDIHTILQDTGLEDLLSFPNVTTGKLLLDSDATRRLTKPRKDLTIIPRGFFDSPTTSTDPPPSTIPTDPPPATPPTDLPSSPARSDAPPPARIRPHVLAGARSLLGRVFPRFRRSQSSTAEPTELPQQCSRPGDVSVPEPTDIAVLAAQDNQFDAIHRLVTPEHSLDRQTTGQRYDSVTIHLETPRPMRRLDRSDPKVVDAPLGEATYGDYVANREDAIPPYSLFFCLGWCQKKEKKKKKNPPPQQYDTDFMDPEQENATADDPIPTTGGFTTQQEGFELSGIASQPQPEAGPSHHLGNADVSLPGSSRLTTTSHWDLDDVIPGLP